MKKFMLALLAGVMMFGLASQAFAEVTVGGDLEVRYDLWNTLDLNRGFNENNSTTQTQNFFADRILLHVDAKVAEGLEGYVELASESGGADERVWGLQGATGFVSPMNYQGETMAVKQAWINFMVPGLPVGVKIGHQPLALGHGIALDSHRMGQDAILLYSKPIPELLVAGVYVKSFDGSAGEPALTGLEHKDVDVYAALANYTFMENNTIGVYYLYGNDKLTLNQTTLDYTGITPVIDNDPTSPTFGQVIYSADPTVVSTQTGAGHLHYIGVVADGAISMINYKAEVVYQDINGKIEGTTMGINHAYAAMLGVGTKLAMADINLEAAYGSGTNGNMNDDSRTFITPYGTTSYNYAFLYNDKIGQNPLGVVDIDRTAAGRGAFGTTMGSLAYGGLGLSDGTGGFGLANTGYIKLSVGVNPMERMTAGLDVLYLRASSSSFNGQSRDLGWEVDAHVGYDIYDNLALDINGGLFVPGAWYAYNCQVDGTVPEANGAVVDETDPDTSLKRNLAYGLETKLTMKF